MGEDSLPEDEHGRDDHRGDAGNEQAILDGGSAALVVTVRPNTEGHEDDEHPQLGGRTTMVGS